MIYTVTVNPALDYVLQLPEVKDGETNRSSDTQFLAGGKGINVSQILNQLGVDNTAWGFVGGFTGEELIRQLNVKKISSDFVRISDDTRVNVKIHAQEETEINAAGPDITDQEVAAFKSRLDDLEAGDVVVLSGSLAPSLPTDFYESLLPLIREKGAEFVVDTTGEALLRTLKFNPLVIKPNHHELADLFDTSFSSTADMLEAAKKLQKLGAQNVMISMAGEGAYLVTADHVYHANAATGTVVNSVGAGDSMIAGFVGTWFEKHDAVEGLRVGSACGGATAFTEDIAVKSQIDAVLPQIKIDVVE
ncbi:phosphofructokinase [Lactobacillus delbrueckii subsp. delbrueckii DSM 20074 = JCM 1012]|uniref:1-phosphofructokinase n=1 Tax=Lactobacillus delbrueckii TaxID=1584 RepID=UPI00047159C4|nr:1-phosphofructokinase [Lactobacillus delbrueckii]APP10332.1 1-phosphofructokinase [Lactobacillus delbrueckii subsp. delbrueckii DSM 20074 = JCM 1012]KNZ37477.1 phosphofructokinase [Lactobacillus delbrueckii subsp. delbrueckii]KRK26570.1 phosphofructokinase [Lactobacillus delbrueckii subsp. delbrueckii DSM 20074 = JCM 1012]MCT3493707.1 1-phosphofructokinase [Lactobacillus delbrueckii]MCT3522505.1 1-phosphofructokinase [Lactobacillus delbrueckii]